MCVCVCVCVCVCMCVLMSVGVGIQVVFLHHKQWSSLDAPYLPPEILVHFIPDLRDLSNLRIER